MTTLGSTPSYTKKKTLGDEIQLGDDNNNNLNNNNTQNVRKASNANSVDYFTKSLQQSQNSDKVGGNNPKINILPGTKTMDSQIYDYEGTNFRGLLHFIFTEFRSIIVLHLLFTAICYTTITVQNMFYFLLKYDFGMMQGNIGDLARCVTNYSFSLVTNLSTKAECNGVEFMMCDGNLFIGRTDKHDDHENCGFKSTELSNIRDLKVINILPFVAFVCTQLMFVLNYVYLILQYKRHGGKFGSGKYIAFCLSMDKQPWYQKFVIGQCMFFVLVCVTPLVVLTRDINNQYGNNILVLIFQLMFGYILIHNMFKKNHMAFNLEHHGFLRIQFKGQSLWQDNYTWFIMIQEAIYNYQKNSNNTNAEFLLDRMEKKSLKSLIKIYEDLFSFVPLPKPVQSQENSVTQLNNISQSKRLEYLRRQQEGQRMSQDKGQRQTVLYSKIEKRMQEIPEESMQPSNQNIGDISYDNNTTNNNISRISDVNQDSKRQLNNLSGIGIPTNNNSVQNTQRLEQVQRCDRNLEDFKQKYNNDEKMERRLRETNLAKTCQNVKPTAPATSSILVSECFSSIQMDEFDGRKYRYHNIHQSQQNFLQKRYQEQGVQKP